MSVTRYPTTKAAAPSRKAPSTPNAAHFRSRRGRLARGLRPPFAAGLRARLPPVPVRAPGPVLGCVAVPVRVVFRAADAPGRWPDRWADLWPDAWPERWPGRAPLPREDAGLRSGLTGAAPGAGTRGQGPLTRVRGARRYGGRHPRHVKLGRGAVADRYIDAICCSR